jgi:hypothetical protein
MPSRLPFPIASTSVPDLHSSAPCTISCRIIRGIFLKGVGVSVLWSKIQTTPISVAVLQGDKCDAVLQEAGLADWICLKPQELLDGLRACKERQMYQGAVAAEVGRGQDRRQIRPFRG